MNTLNALMSRGMDNNTATRLVVEGLTLGDLQQMTSEELVGIGIPKDQAESILDGKRPPIPEDLFLKVLSDSKWVCCICRDSNRGIIVHHIKEWSEGGKHEYDNLAVLCLLHHDEAHTKRGLTLMLSPDRIRKTMKLWHEQVLRRDNSIISGSQYIDDETDSAPKYDVDNVEDFIEAIRSNTTIRLKKGKYNLSDVAKSNINKHVTWHPAFNGYEPHISDIKNLKIIGEEGVEILIDPSYTWVMKFENCKDLVFEKLTCGHTSPGSCTGGVFLFENCQDIKMRECDLFGCGTYGMTIHKSMDFVIHKTKLRECTYGIAQFYGAKNVLFRDCEFVDCKEFDLLTIVEESKNINFLRCKFENNYCSQDYGYFIVTDKTCTDIVIEYSQIYNNKVANWVNIKNVVRTMHNDEMGNKFDSQEGEWWYEK